MGGIALMQISDVAVGILSTDSALLNWCGEHYGRMPTIQVGLDQRNPPEPEECPLILVRPATQRTGDEDIGNALQIDWAVYDERVQITGLVKEYVGVRRVDEMGRLILAALEAGLPAVLSMATTEYVLETVERFPLLLGNMDITINVPAMLSGQLEL